MSEQEFLRCQREQFYDRKFAAALEAAGAEDEAMDAGLGGGEIGDLGGELGGGDEPLDLGGGEDEPADLGGEETPPEEPAGEDDVLLAAPGNRDAGYVTKGSNGKVYNPVASDKRKLGAAHRRTKGS